jgi:hypothetical protein
MVFWIALAVLIVAVVAGIAYVVVRGLALRRDVKRSSAVLEAELDRITEVSLQIELQMAKAEAATGRLKASTDRLATSRAQLDIQLAAIREARAKVRRVFWFVPGV